MFCARKNHRKPKKNAKKSYPEIYTRESVCMDYSK